MAAYCGLIAGGQLPTWALFCHAKLTAGKPGMAPAPLAAIGEGIVLLAPVDNGEEVSGLLIANRTAAGSDVEVTFGDQRVVVSVPSFPESVLAREGVTLAVVRGSRKGPGKARTRTPRKRGTGPS